MIKIEILEKKFKDKVIFNNTSLLVQENKFIAIKGESGIGKSTLIKMLGLIEPFKGKIFFDSNVVTKKNKEQIRRKYISYLFQKPMLLPYLNVRENIIFSEKNLNLEHDEHLFNKIILTLGISDILNRDVYHLSGGEAVRVALARALLSRRKYILCDEPTGALDQKNADNVMKLLKEVQREFGLTFVIVIHSDLYDKLFDNIYCIRGMEIENEKD